MATAVSFNIAGVDAQVSHEVAMQIAAMNPLAVNEEGIPAAARHGHSRRDRYGTIPP